MAGDVKVAVVSAALSTSGTGTTDFTKASFGTPKACIVLLTFDDADNTSVAGEGRYSIGFTDFTLNKCVGHQDEDASASVDCDVFKASDKCYVMLGIGGSPRIDGSASTITDGVRLTNTTNIGGDAPFATVIMFGGADLAVSLDVVIPPNSVGGTVVTTTSIDQDLVFFITSKTGVEDAGNSGIDISFGVAHIDTSDHATFVNRAMGWASDQSNSNGSPALTVRNDRCLKILLENGTANFGEELTAATSTSYTLTERDATSGNNKGIYARALDLDNRKSQIVRVDGPTSGATWDPTVSLAFTPQYVGLGLTHAQSENAVEADADAGGAGISSVSGSGEETCHSFYNEDAAATTNTNNLFRSRAIDLRSHDVATVVQDHSFLSFDSTGWTYTINTENEAIARKWFYWAIEEAAVAGGGRIMSSIAGAGGLAGPGGIAGEGGGLAG